MATKKNPLSSLLATDRRVQATDFRRDLNVRSSVRAAGSYGITVAQPVSLSQTSMGRLAQALGGASGVLKELGDYQQRKEELELQKKSLESRLEATELAGEKAKIDIQTSKLRGAITNESVKQQAIQLEMLREQREVAEFESQLSGMTPEEQRDYLSSFNSEVERIENERDSAIGKAVPVVSQFGTEEQKAPLLAIIADQKLGASNRDSYIRFYKERVNQRLNEFGEQNVTEEEAKAIGEDILDEFLAETNLQGEQRKGFLRSVEKFNKEALAETTGAFINKAKSISNDLLVNKLVGTLDEDVPVLSPIMKGEMQKAANEGDLYTILVGDGKGTGGLYNIARAKGEDALEVAESILDQLGDFLKVDGQQFKDTAEFAKISEDFEKAKDAEAEESIRRLARDTKNNEMDVAAFAKEIAQQKTKDEILAIGEGLNATNLLEKLPESEEVLSGKPDGVDDEIWVSNLVQELRMASESENELADFYIARNSKSYNRLDETNNLTEVLSLIKNELEDFSIPGIKSDSAMGQSTESAEILSTYLRNGQVTDILLERLDDHSGGVISRYTANVRKAAIDVKRVYKGQLSSDEAKEALNNKLNAESEKLQNGLKNYFKETVKTRQRFLNEYSESAGDIEDSYRRYIERAPQKSFKEVSEKIEATLAGEKLEEIEKEAKRRAGILSPSVLNKKSKPRQKLDEIATSLVESETLYADDIFNKPRKTYEDLVNTIEKGEAARIKKGVSNFEIKEIAKTAYVMKDSPLIPIVTAEEQIDFSKSRRGLGSSLDEEEKTIRLRRSNRLQDIEVDRTLFKTSKPPLLELMFDLEPKGQEDVDRAVEQLNSTFSELTVISDLYGFGPDVLSFLKAQYNTDYQKQIRDLRKKKYRNGNR